MLKKLDRIFVITNLTVIGSMMFTMFALVFINVITRYFFGFSLNWAEELSRFLMISICFIGAGLGIREGRHVAIEFIVGLIPSKTIQKAIRIFNALIIIAFMIALTYLGLLYVESQLDQKSAVLRWNMGYIYLIIPIGALVFIMNLIATIKDYIEIQSIEDFEEKDNAVTEGREM